MPEPTVPQPSTPAPGSADGFEATWVEADRIRGWLTTAQARRLWSEATRLGPGALVVEIGSHHGRSTVVLGAAARGSGRVVAVDPFVSGRLFGGRSTRDAFEANVDRFALGGTVELVTDVSSAVRRGWREPVDLVYVDGKHDYWTCSDDLKWAEHLVEGGTLLLHDAFSSVGVTLAVLAHLLPSATLAYAGRDGSLARFVKRRPTATDRLRLVAQLPWWLRNLVIKVLLRLRLRPAVRLLGHDGEYDPF